MTDKKDKPSTMAHDGYRLPGSGIKGGYQPTTGEAGPPPSGGSGGKEPEKPKK